MHSFHSVPPGAAAVDSLEDQGLDGIDQLDSIINGLPAVRTRMIYSIDDKKNRTALRIGDMKLMTGVCVCVCVCVYVEIVTFGLSGHY